MLKRPQLFLVSNRHRGSALVGTLVMVGILALAVGVMISSSNRAIRGSRDKVLFEEAYQAALSGTHITRAWMIDPQLAGTMSGDGGLESDLRDIVWRGLQMNDQILFDRDRDNELNLHGSTTRYTQDPAEFTLGEKVSDGRYVLYEFSQDSPIVSFVNDQHNKKFSSSLFQGTPEGGHRNYVDRIRITTAPMDPNSSVSLTQCTFVIESRGVAEYAGTRKERTLFQQVLLYPKRPGGALMSANESVITKGALTIAGKSHANVHWAPVKAKGNISLEFMETLVPTLVNGVVNSWKLSTASGLGKKFNGAGITITDPNFKYTGVMDKWLRWMAGSQGDLYGVDIATNKSMKPIFHNLKDPSTGASIPVEDFFADVMNGKFSTYNLNSNNLSLLGQYAEALTTMQNPNGIYTAPGGGTSEYTRGALVQRSKAVDESVDTFFGMMNYAELKQYAKNHDGYYVFDGTTLYDATGKPVPSDKYPDMRSQVTASPFDPLLATAAQDRILFIDSLADKDSMEPNNPFTGEFKLPNFWKGVMYVNGSITQSTAGGKGPSMVIRNPDQFAAYRKDGSSSSYVIDNVLIDGIMICNGLAGLAGETTIYGTLAAKDGVAVGGTPSIFYNSANGEGRMKGDQSMAAEFRLIAGRLHE